MFNKKRSAGFTLIEVVLVLAIGGLIFLLAFIAFQQVSRNRRDTQRRSDMGRVIAELQNYYADNSKYPDEPTSTFPAGNATFCSTTGAAGSFTDFTSKNLCGGGGLTNPNGLTYGVHGSANATAFFDRIQYTLNRRCSDTAEYVGSVRVRTLSESGAIICRDL